MDPLLFGQETELAFSVLPRSSTPPEQPALFALPRPSSSERRPPLTAALLPDLIRLAGERTCSMRDLEQAGFFLSNGSRIYADAGAHPEYCTPECGTPEEVVRWQLAGERILEDLVHELSKARPDLAFALYRCNVDYSDSQATWGCHESYQHRTSEQQLRAHLIPHLVTRIVYCGAGGFNNLNERIEFLLSPRVPHLHHAVGRESQHDRSLYHTKNEPLGDRSYSRLHLLCGDSNCSQLANYLKFGTTALIVRLIEADACDGRSLGLHRPVQAMNAFARDPHCKIKRRVRNGARLTAVEVQRAYLESAEAALGEDFMPDWAPRVCERWRTVLDELENDPRSLSTRLDWATKLALFENRVGRSAEQWGELPRGHGLGAELCEVDARFGELDRDGLFMQLDRAGALDHRLPELGSVERAMESPPPGGRAELRGRKIRELSAHGDPGRYLCLWHAIVDQQDGQIFDMRNPYGRDAVWRETPPQSADDPEQARSRSRNRARMLHGIGLYQQTQLYSAATLLANVAEVASEAEDHETEANARFWASTAMHDSGELTDADRVLLPIVERVREQVGIETAIRVLTRHALVLIDGPAERSQIEPVLERMRACSTDLDRRLGRSRLGMVEARWLGAQGDYDEAIRVLEEALLEEESDLFSFARSSYRRWLAYYHHRAGHLDKAREQLDGWGEEVARGGARYESEVMLECARSMHAALKQLPREALHHARLAVDRADRAARNRYRTHAHCALVESAVASEELALAQHSVHALVSWRSSEIGEQRCDLERALSGFQEALATRDGALPRPDSEGPTSALAAAQDMDARLGTTHHAGEVLGPCRPVG